MDLSRNKVKLFKHEIKVNSLQLTQESSLPFFIDRTGSHIDNQAIESLKQDSPPTSLPTDSVGDTVTSSQQPNSGDTKQLSRRQLKRARQQVAKNDSGDEGIRIKIFDAKRRIFNRLNLLSKAEPSTLPASTADGPSSSTTDSREMCFLRVINDRLERDSDYSASLSDANSAADVSDPHTDGGGFSISLGVKSTAHHATAFILGHQDDLADFLTKMRPDRTLWGVDADDILSAFPSSKMRRHLGSRYFKDPKQDPMDVECTVCLKRGHPAESCKRTGPVCILCGREGHPKTECPSRLCSLCLTEGHRPEKCHRYGLLLHSPCDRCGCLGHWKDQCPDIWRQYHSTVSPGCPIRPMAGAAQALEAETESVDSETEARAETGTVGSPDWCQFVGKVSQSVYCCNCAQSGHSVHECLQPKSLLNRCFGSFHSQRVHRYDSMDPFSAEAAASAASSRQANLEVSLHREAGHSAACSSRYFGYDAADAGGSRSTSTASAARCKEVQLAADHSGRMPPQVGEAFIPLVPVHEAQPQRRLTFREELDQMRNLARRLLPEGASRSQVKKLTNRLKYWRRNGYQPTTPEEEDQLSDRMEEWVLEKADSHNYMHKLNFKRRCRLLNSTGAALELIRSCRQYAEPPVSRKTGNPKQKKSRARKKKLLLTVESISSRKVANTEPASVSSAQHVPSKFASDVVSWSGRLRSRPTATSESTSSTRGARATAAAAAAAPKSSHPKPSKQGTKQQRKKFVQNQKNKNKQPQPNQNQQRQRKRLAVVSHQGQKPQQKRI